MRTRSTPRPAAMVRGLGLVLGTTLLLSACSGGLLGGGQEQKPPAQPAAQTESTQPTPTPAAPLEGEGAGAGGQYGEPSTDDGTGYGDSGAGTGYGDDDQAGDQADAGADRYGAGGEGEADTAPEGAGEDAVTLAVADTDLGPVLTDGQGRTLYGFTNDEGGTSSCYEDCAANWPPLLVDAARITVDGDVDQHLVGITQRQDGTKQITYNHWPLYYYAADQQAGNTNGQGVGDVWWVLDAAGQLVTE